MENYNQQQKVVFAVYAIVGAVVFGFLMMLINGGFSYSNFKAVLLPSLIFGIFMGIALPFFLKKMVPLLEKKIETPQLQENETIVLEERANFFRNKWIAAGGKLFLTNKRLIFSAHKFNLKNGETSIPLQEIDKFQGRKTGHLVDNGLRVEIADNSIFDFVVNHRSQWIEHLNNG